MSITLSSLLLCLLIIPSDGQNGQTLTIGQKIDGVGRWLKAWKASDIIRQEEYVEDLNGVVLAAIEVVDEGVRGQLEKLLVDLAELVNVTVGQNASSQFLAELQTLRGRQAVSAAVQVCQVLMFVGYLLTIFIIYMVKRCQKVRERKQRKEFELLEKKLQTNKAKRRAAAAKAKSAPGPSQE